MLNREGPGGGGEGGEQVCRKRAEEGREHFMEAARLLPSHGAPKAVCPSMGEGRNGMGWVHVCKHLLS